MDESWMDGGNCVCECQLPTGRYLAQIAIFSCFERTGCGHGNRKAARDCAACAKEHRSLTPTLPDFPFPFPSGFPFRGCPFIGSFALCRYLLSSIGQLGLQRCLFFLQSLFSSFFGFWPIGQISMCQISISPDPALAWRRADSCTFGGCYGFWGAGGAPGTHRLQLRRSSRARKGPAMAEIFLLTLAIELNRTADSTSLLSTRFIILLFYLGFVLLINNNKTLPLGKKTKLGKLALVGPLADDGTASATVL